MNVSILEQETTISFARNEEFAKIWTSDSTIMTKLDKLVIRDPKNWQCEIQKDKDGDIVAKVYTVQKKKLISFRAEQILSEEEKQRRTELLKSKLSHEDTRI